MQSNLLVVHVHVSTARCFVAPMLTWYNIVYVHESLDFWKLEGTEDTLLRSSLFQQLVQVSIHFSVHGSMAEAK